VPLNEERLQVWVPTWLAERARGAAARQGMTLSAWLRELVEHASELIRS
jgi:hypothetical protein